MELLLNALWLLLSAGTVLVWVRQGRFARKSHRVRHGLLVLGCVVALLFPVISMTDDLHAQQFAIEDAAAKTKKLLNAAERSKSSVHSLHSPAIVEVYSAHCPRWQRIGSAHKPAQPAAVSFASLPSSGRAPPSLS